LPPERNGVQERPNRRQLGRMAAERQRCRHAGPMGHNRQAGPGGLTARVPESVEDRTRSGQQRCMIAEALARSIDVGEKRGHNEFRTGLSAVCLLIAESTRAPGAAPSPGSMVQCQKGARALPRVAIVASLRRTAAR
jgi:hypothetical protein